MQQIHILLVDDNEGDILLTREALDDARIINKISIAYDGLEAIRFLKKGPIGDTPDLKRIPVIMLTTSSAEKDILASYDNHANCYITKPVDLDRFMNVVRTIEDFWISIVKLPKAVQ